jgi:Cytochrome oxidase complex assembly protein 1
MSMPTQPGPAAQQSGGNGNRTVLLVLLAVALVMMFCCCGICGGALLVFAFSRTRVEQVRAAINETIDPQASQQWINDWAVQQHLTGSYTTALDTVVADERVVARLGEPIEPANDPDALFRREGEGNLNNEGETIVFDIKGPKQTAVVRVEAATAVPGVWQMKLKKITVVLSDGSEIDVPVPAEEREPRP